MISVENLLYFYQSSDGKTKKRYLAASFQKKSILTKIKLQLFLFTNRLRFYSTPVRFYRGVKKKRRSKKTSFPIWLPLLTKDAAIMS